MLVFPKCWICCWAAQRWVWAVDFSKDLFFFAGQLAQLELNPISPTPADTIKQRLNEWLAAAHQLTASENKNLSLSNSGSHRTALYLGWGFDTIVLHGSHPTTQVMFPGNNLGTTTVSSQDSSLEGVLWSHIHLLLLPKCPYANNHPALLLL